MGSIVASRTSRNPLVKAKRVTRFIRMRRDFIHPNILAISLTTSVIFFEFTFLPEANGGGNDKNDHYH